MTIRTLRLILWAAAGVAFLASAWFLVLAPRFNASVTDTIGHGDYRLEATDGRVFDQAALEGQPSAVFFGFTHCPEICPTTLGDIGAWETALGADADRINFWFVTVDPERDTVDLLRDYVSWSPGVIGAGGDPAEVEKAIRAFKVYARRVPIESGGYTMDHSTYVMLFDSDGRFDQVIAYQEPEESAVAKLRALIARG